MAVTHPAATRKTAASGTTGHQPGWTAHSSSANGSGCVKSCPTYPHGRDRRVHGYGLVFRGGSWYLVGQDAEAADPGGLRRFRVDRLESDPVAGTPGGYERPEGFDAANELRFVPFQPSRDGPVEPEWTEVEITVDAREAAGVVAAVGAAAVRDRADDGSVRLVFPVGDEEAFLLWVLGFGDAIEVIGPPDMRRNVVRRLEAAARAGKTT